MVDAGIAGSQRNILSAIRSITEAPIKYLINTHWHFDHTDGSAWVHNAGASIIAHENTLKNLSKTITIPEWDYTFPPAPAAALPTTVFQNEMKLEFNSSEIRMNIINLPTLTQTFLYTFQTRMSLVWGIRGGMVSILL